MAPDLALRRTPIPGLVVLDLPVHRDARGWFKENWQRAKMTALGLPDFGPVQNNVSFNTTRGATRGIHAEPWDKLVSVSTGRVFAAWVDLRAGPSFGTTCWTEIDESVAVFVPRGVGNSYQALVDDTVYSYLVNDHYVAGRTYAAVAVDDPTAAIPWPIPLTEAEISEKDQRNPRLADVTAMPTRSTLVLGAHGQLGRALRAQWPEATFVGRDELDLADAGALAGWDWGAHDVVVNAAAYTAVDAAETAKGRAAAWAVNAAAPAQLACLADAHYFTLVHISSDYVFDGTSSAYAEDAPVAPLGVYGQTKAAGDLAVGTAARHYILRTSWIIGDGPNFVRTMRSLSERDVSPAVVDDQIGRLTFSSELARAIAHLLDLRAPYGTYNCTGAGPARSWYDYARDVFARTGHDPDRVTATTMAAYGEGKQLAPRPACSVLKLDKLIATGFKPMAVEKSMAAYLGEASPDHDELELG